jgi:hypothetical protein
MDFSDKERKSQLQPIMVMKTGDFGVNEFF